MRRDSETGFLAEEIEAYDAEDTELLVKFYAEGEPLMVHMLLSTPPDLEMSDEDYEDIYDSYETEALSAEVSSAEEAEGWSNPTWDVIIPWDSDVVRMTGKINRILALHKAELDLVFSMRGAADVR